MHACLWQGGTMTDLGTLPGFSHSVACDINNNGQIVGYCFDIAHTYDFFGLHAKGSVTDPTGQRAFLWYAGQMTDLGTLPGDAASAALAINDAGDVVGWSRDSASSLGSSTPLMVKSTVLYDLNSCVATPGAFTEAVDINASGQIVVQGGAGFVLTPSAR